MTNTGENSGMCGCGNEHQALERITQMLVKMANDDECCLFQMAVLIAASQFKDNLIHSFIGEAKTASEALHHIAVVVELSEKIKKRFEEGDYINTLNAALEVAINRNNGQHPKIH